MLPYDIKGDLLLFFFFPLEELSCHSESLSHSASCPFTVELSKQILGQSKALDVT